MPIIDHAFLASHPTFPIALDGPHEKWILSIDIDLPADHTGPVFRLGPDVQVFVGEHRITRDGLPYATPLDSALDPATSTIRARAFTRVEQYGGTSFDGSGPIPVRSDYPRIDRNPGEW